MNTDRGGDLVGSESESSDGIKKTKYGARIELKLELILGISVPDKTGEHRSSTWKASENLNTAFVPK